MPSATGRRLRMPASSMIAAVSADSSPSVRHAVDEGFVDLQDVDGEAADVVQRGVAGSEVVDRELDAQVLQLLRRDRQVHVLHHHGLGDLEHEALGSEPASPGARARPPRRAPGAGAAGREVDGHVQGRGVGAPVATLCPCAACLPQHPRADGDDQARLLGERDEVQGRPRPRVGVVPSDQGFEPLDLARLRARSPAGNAA